MTPKRTVPRPPPATAAGGRRSRSPREILAQHVAHAGLKHSRQRDTVLDVFLETTGHVSVDELTGRVHHRDPGIGHTTVYRTMKLLAECGVASARQFGDGHTRYELDRPGAHHDHLVCAACGSIEEFEDDEIEQMQLVIARRHGFLLEGHTFELHGRCSRCRAPRQAGRTVA